MKRRTTAVGLLVGGLLLAGCTSPAEEPPGLTASPTGSASPTPTVDQEALQMQEDEAAVLDVYERYWDILVAMSTGAAPVEPQAFDGVATGVAVEERVGFARAQAEQGIVLTGAPTFSDITIDIEGDVANVAACVDHAGYRPEGFVEDASGSVRPNTVRVERVDGQWLVTATGVVPEGLPC